MKPNVGRNLSSWLRYRFALAPAAVAVGIEFTIYYVFMWLTNARPRGLSEFLSFFAAGRISVSSTAGPAYVYSAADQAMLQNQIAQHLLGATFPLIPYVHPPWFTPLMSVIVHLPYGRAYVAWLSLSALMAGFALWTLLGSNPDVPRGYVIGAYVSFVPLLVSLMQGQSDSLMLLAVAGCYSAWVAGKMRLAGLLASIAFVKPQLIVLIPALFLARRAWPALNLMLISIGAVVAATVIWSWQGVLRYVQVVAQWGWGASRLPISQHDGYSIRILLEMLPGGRGLALVALVILLGLIGLGLSWSPDSRRIDMALAISASLVLSPFQNWRISFS